MWCSLSRETPTISFYLHFFFGSLWLFQCSVVVQSREWLFHSLPTLFLSMVCVLGQDFLHQKSKTVVSIGKATNQNKTKWNKTFFLPCLSSPGSSKSHQNLLTMWVCLVYQDPELRLEIKVPAGNKLFLYSAYIKVDKYIGRVFTLASFYFLFELSGAHSLIIWNILSFTFLECSGNIKSFEVV